MLLLQKLHRYTRNLFAVMTLGAVLLLQGCSDDPTATNFSIGGTLSNLTSANIVLQNNGGDDLTLTTNSSFTFSTKLSNSIDYAVTIKTQPDKQSCTVSNDTGTVSGANITNISVDCTAIATGYYKDGSIEEQPSVTDYQAMIYNNRIIIFSWSEELSFDGTINLTGNDFSVTLTQYKGGVKVTESASYSGTITGGSQITGTLSDTSGGSYNGTLTIGYADNNDDTADISKVHALSTLGIFADLLDSLDIAVDSEGNIFGISVSSGTYLDSCKLDSGLISVINGTNLYEYTLTLTDDCSTLGVKGTYTGFGTTKTRVDADDYFVTGITNGSYAIIGDFD